MNTNAPNYFKSHYNFIVVVAVFLSVGLALTFDIFALGQTSADLYVTVKEIKPDGQTTAEKNITIQFSRDMVSIKKLDVPDDDYPLQFDPPLAGIARWIEQDIIRFFPEYGLSPATLYKLKIKSDKIFLYGNKISDKRTFAFNTPPLKLESYFTDVEIEDVKNGTGFINIQLRFNYLVDMDVLQKKLSLKGIKDTEKSKLSFELTDIGGATSKGNFSKNINIKTEQISLTDLNQEYQLAIKYGLNCFDCGDKLELTLKRTVMVYAKRRLHINQVNARPIGEYGAIYIYINQKISVDDAKEYITVSPKIDFSIEAGYRNLILHGKFRPGEKYTVTIKPGLSANDGSYIMNEFSTVVSVPHLRPSLNFVARNIFLPKAESKLVELETINVDNLTVEVEQIFSNNLIYALGTNLDRNNNAFNMSLAGKKYFRQEKELESEKNKKLTTTIDMGAIIGDKQKGIFVLSAYNKNSRWNKDSRFVMLTDMGLVARYQDDYLMVWVNSLSETEPKKNVVVRLISKINQILLEGKTDSKGIVVFENIAKNIEGFVPFIITAEQKDDLTFLKFADCLLPINDFDIKGRPFLTKGYEAYLSFDRGVYRPSDTVHLSSIVRGANGKMPDEFPYFLIVKDPSGREFKSFRVSTKSDAMLTQDFELPSFSKTGQYSVLARIGNDYVIGRAGFQVEEFMPDRIKVKLKTNKKEYSLDESIQIDVEGKYLFGAPTKGHNVSGHVTVESYSFRPAQWSKYRFINSDLKFSKIEYDLPKSNLNDKGFYTYQYKIPQKIKSPSALKGLISVSVFEQGGRAVSNYTEIVIHPYDRYIGMRLNFEGYAKPGQNCQVALVAVDREKRAVGADSVAVKFYRVVYHSLRKQVNGRYHYVSEKTNLLVDSAYVDVTTDGAVVNFTPPQYGQYLVVATNKENGHSSSINFYASGWGYAPWSMEKPNRIEIDLDFEKYKIGDSAKVQIKAPFSGRLLLTVEKEKVLDFISIDLKENTAEIKIPIKEEYFPNVYVTATIIKKAKDIERTTPARAFGIAPLMLEKSHKEIDLTIIAPEVVKPNQDLTITIESGTHSKTTLTVAAVDEGILQLTDFKDPNPLEFFFGKRRSYLNMYDNYAYVYPQVDKSQSHLNPSGGAMFSEKRKRHLNPISARRVKSVALWSGKIETDHTGKATVTFKVPEFNGKLRIMAVAAQGDKFGAASKGLIVRDNIILQESFPRFTTPNDIVNGLVTVYNNMGHDAEIQVEAQTEGPLDVLSKTTQMIFVPKNSEAKVVFRFKSKIIPGKMSFKIIATSGIEKSEINFEIPNRPGQPITTEYGFGLLNGSDSTTLQLPDSWVAKTNLTSIQTSSLAAVSFSKNINYLIQYPYGCVEQTTSRLLPLLHFNDLVRFVKPEFIGTKGADYFIQEGILKLSNMLRPDGWFSYWPNGNYVNKWGSIYASHFLLQAKENDYQIDKKLYKNIVKYLKKISRGQSLGKQKPNEQEQIYAAYVLAKVHLIENKILNSIRKIEVEKLPLFSRYQLATILALSGNKESAIRLMPAVIVPAIFDAETGGTFSSGVRTNAILLDALMTIDANDPSCAVLAKSLTEDARVGRWGSTQSTAWALMILGDYFSGKEVPDFKGTIKISNDSSYNFDQDGIKLLKKDLIGEQVQIKTEGKGDCYYYWQSSGVPLSNAPREFSNGIIVSRTYLSEDGTPVDLKNLSLGSQIICHIQIESTHKNIENVVVNDLLPAGIEIENQRLKTTPKLSWIPKKAYDITYQDIRDDRLLLFTNLRLNRKVNYYYTARVISSGEFKIPPIAAECMYNPVIAGAASSGVMIVHE